MKFTNTLISCSLLLSGSAFANNEYETVKVNANLVGTGQYDIAGQLTCTLLEKQVVRVVGNDGKLGYMFSRYAPTSPVTLSGTSKHESLGGFVEFAKVSADSTGRAFQFPIVGSMDSPELYQISSGPLGIQIKRGSAIADGAFDSNNRASATLADDKTGLAVKCEFEPQSRLQKFINSFPK